MQIFYSDKYVFLFKCRLFAHFATKLSHAVIPSNQELVNCFNVYHG